MTLEQADHLMRHMEGHAEALRIGSFSKDISYIKRLREAQYLFLEVSHDMVHVMRTKQFKGYENADFDFVVDLPKDWKEHQFRKFDFNSFSIGLKLRTTLDLGMVTEKNILLTCEQAVQQLGAFANAIQDAEVFIKMLNEYFDK